MMRLVSFLPGWLALWLAFGAPAGALEVQQFFWGFDGRVLPGKFNPLSVLVANPGPRAFEGEIALRLDQPSSGGGMEYVQAVFLAPRTARWVQFHVLNPNLSGNYVLLWGRGARERFDLLTELKAGPPACVWLRESENPFATAGALKTFPEELFPTTAAATDGLDAVVLDHVPRWEPARRAAFLDWLKRGGTVHLLPTAEGQWPRFAEGLEMLNGEQIVAHVGAGRVVRHQVAAREMSERYLSERGYPARTFQQAQNPVIYDLDSSLFRTLSSMTRPRVNWTAIHILALGYVIVIGPLQYRFRRRLDFRVSIAVFLGVVALFATAFAFVGRRGYGESQTVHSLALARSVGGGRHDVTQWISAFVTTGDIYTLTHAAPANLYSTGSNFDAGRGRAYNGREGRLLLDIPLYSSQVFIHRAVMAGDDTSVTVEQWEGDGSGLKKLRLRPGPNFPKAFSEAQIIAGGWRHALVSRDGVLELQGAPEKITSVFSREKLAPLTYRQPTKKTSPRELLPMLAARVLNAPDIFPQTLSDSPSSAERIQMLVAAPSPAPFHLRSEGFQRESGWVLYVQDIFKP